MRILIIEDDEFKQKRLEQVVREFQPDAEVLVERSVNSGLKGIFGCNPDLILLDMSLTTFDVGPSEAGGRPQNFGGIEILRQMDRRDIKKPVIVITQHEKFATANQEIHLSTVYKELRLLYGDVFCGLIYYNSATGNWEKNLKLLITEATKRGQAKDAPKNSRRRR